MTALSQDRDTKIKDGVMLSLGVAAATKIYAGALVALNATGYATKGATAAGMVAIGRAEEYVDNSDGADGALNVAVRRGVFRFANSAAADLITIAEIGDVCYIVDDQTVAKTSDSAARSPAGLVVDVDAQGVWVDTGVHPVAAAAGGLAAANNLSDVANAATARGNLGTNTVYQTIEGLSLVGADAAVRRVLAMKSGTVTKIWTVLNGQLTVGNASVTAAIGGTPLTNGAVAITQAGSAAGDVDSATPTAANAVVAGTSVLTLTAGGTNEADVTADVVIEITF